MNERIYDFNHCNNKDNKVCFIYVFDQIDASNAIQNGIIDTLGKVADYYSKDKVNIYYTDTLNIDYYETFEEEQPARPYILIVKGKR